MDLNNFLFVATVLISILTLWRHRVISFEEAKGWKIKFAIVPAAAIILDETVPDFAGYILAGYWAGLVLLPSLFVNKASRLSLASRHSEAASLMRKAAALHPFDGIKQSLKMLESLDLAQHGFFEDAKENLRLLAEESGRIRELALAQILRLDENWTELAYQLGRVRELGGMTRQPALLGFYLRALGETGQTALLASEIHRFERLLVRVGLIHQARLFLLAFSGDVEGAMMILSSRLPEFSLETGSFWIATALQSRGDYDSAAEVLGKISRADDAILAKSAELRAATPLKTFTPWANSAAQAMIDSIRSKIKKEAPLERPQSELRKAAKATQLIICANILVFIVELALGGAENEETLIRMGAFIPELTISSGQGLWRIFAAQFLHFGLLHLAMNMFGLHALGPLVESALGRARFAALYILSGLGGFAAVILSVKYLHSSGGFYVGASAGVLGIVGATTAIYLRSWAASRTPLAKNRLTEILTIIALQVVFDASIPEVSGTAHIGGLISGFLLCWAFLVPKKTRRESNT